MCKLGPELYIPNCNLRQNYVGDKGKEIRGMKLNITAITIDSSIPFCLAIHDILETMQKDST